MVSVVSVASGAHPASRAAMSARVTASLRSPARRQFPGLRRRQAEQLAEHLSGVGPEDRGSSGRAHAILASGDRAASTAPTPAG